MDKINKNSLEYEFLSQATTPDVKFFRGQIYDICQDCKIYNGTCKNCPIDKIISLIDELLNDRKRYEK